MSQELEIEFKNMLTKEEYLLLLNAFKELQEETIMQENHYFDTPLFHLKETTSALRIREKNNRYQLTLKQPVEEGVLETHQEIHALTAKDMLQGGGLPTGEISELLTMLGVPVQEIVHFGTLTTNRVEFPYEGGLLVLDHSHYLGEEDYEVEYEVTNREEGEKAFLTLLSSYNIPVRETDTKIKRFYKRKIQQMRS